MKVYKEQVRDYYKYQYRNWTQPILTSNGTLGVGDFAVYCPENSTTYPAYYAFDGTTSNFVVTHNNDYIIYSANALNITSISMSDRSSSYNFKGGELYGSNNNKDWELIQAISGTTWNLSSNKKYYNYYKIKQTVSGDWQPSLFTVVAKEQISVKGTEYDYDYYTSHDGYKLFTFPNTKYYKFTSWTQPTLTSNGIMGVSNFACYANRSYDATPVNAYQAFSPNTGYVASYKSLAYSTLYIYFQSKNYLKLSNFSFYIPIKNSNNDTGGGYANTLKLEGFNANTNSWEQLAYIAGGTNMGNKTHTMNLSTNSKYYKLYRFQGRTGGGGHHDEIDISNITITAQQAAECEKGQHDFYEENLIYKAIP